MLVSLSSGLFLLFPQDSAQASSPLEAVTSAEKPSWIHLFGLSNQTLCLSPVPPPTPNEADSTLRAESMFYTSPGSGLHLLFGVLFLKMTSLFSVDALSLLWHHEACVLWPRESKPEIQLEKVGLWPSWYCFLLQSASFFLRRVQQHFLFSFECLLCIKLRFIRCFHLYKNPLRYW